MSTQTNLKDQTSLPPIEKFYTTLNNKEDIITLKMFGVFLNTEICVIIWICFGGQMFSYQQIYLKILDKFVEIFINQTPQTIINQEQGLSWDAVLKSTKIKLFTDINMYNFVKTSIRGGIVQCSKRHAIANNKYLEDYGYSVLKQCIES